MDSAIKDYCQYLKPNSDVEMQAVLETTDNILMRLEEYKGTLEIIKSECIDIQSIYNEILAMRKHVNNLKYRIDAMEVFISKVHQDLNTLETQLIEAEQDIPNKSESSLKSLLKPILFKLNSELSNNESSSSGGMSNATISSYEKVEVFNTAELFKTEKN